MKTLSRCIASAAALVAAAAHAEVGPVGGEFQANTFTTSFQGEPTVAADAAHEFVIVWQSGSYYGSGSQDGSSAGVFGQRFDGAGARAGTEFRVNTYTLGLQGAPAVAKDPAGSFVVTWQSGTSSYYGGITQDGSATGVFLQRYDATGTPEGVESRVNTTTRGRQALPAVARDASGGFVVVWQSGGYRFPADGSSQAVFGQRYDATGAPSGGEFQVNSTTAGPQFSPAVATDPLGNFVVAWMNGYYSGVDVRARRFDSAGTPLGPDFQVNTYTTGPQVAPSVASDALGNFVVAWQSGYYGTGQDGSGGGIFAQRYDNAGLPIDGEFQVNTYTTGNQAEPSVASDADGNFVVAWASGYYSGGIFGQHFAANGTPVGLEFQVNSYTTGSKRRARVAATPDGDFVVAWEGAYAQDGSSRGVFGQRFRTTAFGPPELIAGNRLVLRDGPLDPRKKSLSVRADDPAIDLGQGEGSIDDPILSGGRVRVRSAQFDDTYELPAANWRASGSGASRSYQYRDPALLAGPVKGIRVRRGRFKIVGRGAQLGHGLAINPTPVTVVLQIGDRGQRYCAQYGGTTEYKPDVVYRGRRAPAPSACPR